MARQLACAIARATKNGSEPVVSFNGFLVKMLHRVKD